MTPILQISPGVKWTGIQPEMAIVLDVVPVVFFRKGHDCWLTSAVRPGDDGDHGDGRGLDFDSSTNIPYDTGKEIEASVQGYIGHEFYVSWHGPRWHLHTGHRP